MVGIVILVACAIGIIYLIIQRVNDKNDFEDRDN